METNEKLALAADIMEKSASYISELEAKLDISKARVAELEKEAQARLSKDEVAEPLNKLASHGFTEHELDSMMSLGKETLEKIASQTDSPVGMGSAHGTSTAGMDPLTAFLMQN